MQISISINEAEKLSPSFSIPILAKAETQSIVRTGSFQPSGDGRKQKSRYLQPISRKFPTFLRPLPSTSLLCSNSQAPILIMFGLGFYEMDQDKWLNSSLWSLDPLNWEKSSVERLELHCEKFKLFMWRWRACHLEIETPL